MTLEVLTSDLLGPVQHGFFTRKGGASSGVFSGLNCGHGSTDQTDIVNINRDRAAQALGVELPYLVTVHQIHSAHAVTIDAPLNGAAPRADAMVTATPGLALAILTADCQPILFADKTAGVIGAAHAGWKGALHGVIEATIDGMEALGATRENIHAAIGPTISQKSYEVGEEFVERFIDEDRAYARFFSSGKSGKMHFDLPGFGLFRLREAGVGEAEWIRHCTYSDAERFYSYRRCFHLNQADYGRLLSAIRL
jgi:hypothetical protein